MRERREKVEDKCENKKEGKCASLDIYVST
jgi:hypothetical protein